MAESKEKPVRTGDSTSQVSQTAHAEDVKEEKLSQKVE